MFVLLFLLTSLSYSDGAQIAVDMDKSTVNALLNEDVLLKCLITGFPGSELQLESVGILWNYFNGIKKTKIYSVKNVEHFSERDGAKVYKDGVKYGNASLHLQHVKLSEEGEYECVVYVTPEKAEGRSRLQVSAQPKVNVSAEVIENVDGKETLLTCKVQHFFPRTINVVWKKKSFGITTEIEKNICMQSPAHNDDGTFSMISWLRLQPATAEDIKNNYECIVTHRTLPDGFSMGAILTEKPPVSGINVGALIACIIPLTLGLIIGGAYLYGKRRGQGEPKISNILVPKNIVHKEQTTFNCSVTGFRPADIQIQWFLEFRDGRKEKICDWNSSADAENTPDAVCIPLLPNAIEPVVENEAVSVQITQFKKCADGTYSVTCSLLVFLDINIHNEAKLIVEVTHSTLKEPLLKTIELHVQGVHPTLSSIMKLQHVRHCEPLTLSCAVETFKPRPLTITWFQTDSEGKEHEIVCLDEQGGTKLPGTAGSRPKYIHHLTENPHENGHTYSVLSVLMFVPVIKEDNNSTYHCRVHHLSKQYETSKVTLEVKASPKFDKIQIITETPFAGEVVELSCKIHSFCPKNIHIEWLKEDEKLPHFKISEIRMDEDGLYYLTSTVTFISNRTDFKRKIKCRVNHESLTEPQEQIMIFQPILTPRMSTITTSEVPCLGIPVTLSLIAEDHFPADFVVLWTRGNGRAHVGKISECTESKETGLFTSRSSKLITPTWEDQDMKYTAEMYYSRSGTNPIFVDYFLFLKDFPVVTDILCDPPVPLYGQKLKLSCEVKGFSAKDMETSWFKENEKCSKGVTLSKSKIADDMYDLHSCLELVPTGLDYKKEFSFKVKHSHLEEPFIKKTILGLQAISPTLSQLKTSSNWLTSSNMNNLVVNISDYAPSDITVTWYQNNELFTGKCVNSAPVIKANGLFSSSSEIKLDRGTLDHSSTMMCEVEHKATNNVKRTTCPLQLKGCLVLSEICCYPEEPLAGEEVKLSCDVTKIPSQLVTVHWFKEEKEIKDGVTTTEPVRDGSGCYKLKTELRFITTQEDDGIMYAVNVQHQNFSFTCEEKFNCMLFKCQLSVSEIHCLPEEPSAEEEVTLSCDVTGLSSPRATVKWFKKDKEIQNNVLTTEPLRAKEGYTLKAEIKFIAKQEDNGTEYTVKVLDSELNTSADKNFVFMLFRSLGHINCMHNSRKQIFCSATVICWSVQADFTAEQ
ncbi:uncharacterized protein LOC122810505 [Protopterus annectens]|uniref:uncharacterized protein LOC122810505 n=1 Tax=Protopterus annectens TaxID=7888 RepID=UPI001CF940F7|nr:uncharacterized protein LOC122810505 [Protopterus annectens]